MTAEGTCLLLACLLIMILLGKATKNDSTCVGGCFKEGMDAVVVCNFTVNVRESRHGFSLIKYPFSLSPPSQEQVLACNFKPDGNTVCSNSRDVQLDGPLTEFVSFRISHVKTYHSGMYVCQLASTPASATDQFCILAVTGTFADSSEDTVCPVIPESKPPGGQDSNCTFAALLTLQMIVIVGVVTVVIHLCLYKHYTGDSIRDIFARFRNTGQGRQAQAGPQQQQQDAVEEVVLLPQDAVEEAVPVQHVP